MKYLLPLVLLLSACSPTNTTKTKSQNRPTNTEQIYLDTPTDQTPTGLPGICYTKLKLNREFRWTETICPNSINKSLIKQLQLDLQRLGYAIDDSERSTGKLGATTKSAIKDFQLKNNIAYGGLDWATVNRISME